MPSKNTAQLAFGSVILYKVDALEVRDSKELRAEYSRLRDIAVKRLKRLEKSEFATGATVKNYKDMFPKLKEIKTEAELKKRLSDVAKFVDMKTSTVSGIKEKRKKQLEALHAPEYNGAYDWVTEENYDQFAAWVDNYVNTHATKYRYPAPEQIREAYEEEFGAIDSEELKKEFEASKPQKKPRERRKKTGSAEIESYSRGGRQKKAAKRRRR